MTFSDAVIEWNSVSYHLIDNKLKAKKPQHTKITFFPPYHVYPAPFYTTSQDSPPSPQNPYTFNFRLSQIFHF
jgi:hypothetical protein